MIEFEKHKSSSYKWSKKFPRAKINHHGGDRKAAKVVGWYMGNWNDDIFQSCNYNLLTKFLKANLGKPVNKVYTDFLRRCKKSMKSEDLKEFFYRDFHEKDYDEAGDYFYVSNGILNYKKKVVKPYKYDNTLWKCLHFNNLTFPNKKHLAALCTEAKNNHTLVHIGDFYVYDTHYDEVYKKEVFIATLDDFKEKFFYMKNIYLSHNGARGLNVAEGYEGLGNFYSLNYGGFYHPITPNFVFLVKNKIKKS